MTWKDLSMSQKSDLMNIYLKHGIYSLDEMKEHYNSFGDGGKLSNAEYYSTREIGNKGGYLYDSRDPKYNVKPLESIISVSDNTRYTPIITDAQNNKFLSLFNNNSINQVPRFINKNAEIDYTYTNNKGVKRTLKNPQEKINSKNYKGFVEQLDRWLEKNPTIKLNNVAINSTELKDFIVELAYLESNFNQYSNKDKGTSFKGYFQINGLKNYDFDSQMRALVKHTNDKIKTLTKGDLERAKKLGYSDSEILAKLHNQGYHLQNFLLNNKEGYDGNGVPVSVYGRGMTPINILNNLVTLEDINNDYVLNNGEFIGKLMPRFRIEGIDVGQPTSDSLTVWHNNHYNRSVQRKGDTIFVSPR